MVVGDKAEVSILSKTSICTYNYAAKVSVKYKDALKHISLNCRKHLLKDSNLFVLCQSHNFIGYFTYYFLIFYSVINAENHEHFSAKFLGKVFKACSHPLRC